MKSKYLTILPAVREAGDKIVAYFDQVLSVERKSMASDFRTKADTESERIIISAIKKYFPGYNIFGEETGISDFGSEYQFVIDPLDGTNNFSIGIPDFTISIALQQNNTTIFGLVYRPITKSVCWAEKGKGAWLNGKNIRVNIESNFENSTVNYSCGYHLGDNEFRYSLDRNFNHNKIKRLIENWSVAGDLVLLASGKIEALIANKIDLYDFAAGRLIATEAGAKVTDFEGKEIHDDCDPQFVVSNGTKLHQRILELIKK